MRMKVNTNGSCGRNGEEKKGRDSFIVHSLKILEKKVQWASARKSFPVFKAFLLFF